MVGRSVPLMNRAVSTKLCNDDVGGRILDCCRNMIISGRRFDLYKSNWLHLYRDVDNIFIRSFACSVMEGLN